MKFRFFIFAALITLFCLCFVSCGEKKDTSNSDVQTTDTAALSDTQDTKAESDSVADSEPVVTEPVSDSNIYIGENDIKNFKILLSSDAGESEKNIADYIAAEIKAITLFDIPVVTDSGETYDNVIAIGKTAVTPDFSIEADEFIIKVDSSNLYIVYSNGEFAYQAVTTVLAEELFMLNSADKNEYSLSDGTEIIGKCGDYVIGDNEFNPFD